MKIGIGDEVHGYLIKIHVEYSLKPHRTGQVRQQTCDDIVHPIIRLLCLTCYLRTFCDLLLSAFVLCHHFFHGLDDVLQGLVVNRQCAVRMFHDFIQSEETVVRGGDYIIVFTREDRGSETEDLREFFFKQAEDVRP